MVSINTIRSVSPARVCGIYSNAYHTLRSSLAMDTNQHQYNNGQLVRQLQISSCKNTSPQSRLKTKWGDYKDEFKPSNTCSFGCWEPESLAKLNDCVGKDTMDEVPPLLMPSLLRLRAENTPDDIAMSVFRNNEWQNTTYSEYYENTRTVAKAFIELGLEPFCSVNPIGFNSPEHYIAFQAAPMAGGFMAGIYPTNSPPAVHYVSKHSKGQIAVVENEEQLQKFLKIKSDLPDLKAIIQYVGEPSQKGVLSWSEVMKLGKSLSDDKLDKRISNLSVNQAALLVYTSGTTGNPKGVMLSHDAVTFAARLLGKHTGIGRTEIEKQVQYMPVNHAGASIIGVECMIAVGGQCWFAASDAMRGALVEHFKKIGPTEMCIQVPRIWEKFHENLAPQLKSAKGAKKLLIDWSMKQGMKRSNELMNCNDGSSTLGYKIANKLLFNKIKTALGMEKLAVFYTAGAPLNEEIKEYFCGLDILIRELYGSSESGCLGMAQYPDIRMKKGTIGKAYPEIEVRIHNPDKDGFGDICLRGRSMMMGYLHDKEKTLETLDEEGWLHTGDLGKIDDEGYVILSGRIKEIIITSGGENIGPVQIEDVIKEELPCLSNSMVIGDGRKYLTVLLTFRTVLNMETGIHTDDLDPIAIKWLNENNHSEITTLTQVLSNLSAEASSLASLIQLGLDRANAKAVSNAQKVQKWVVLERDFSMAMNELTPTLKMKRATILKMYKDKIDKMYQ